MVQAGTSWLDFGKFSLNKTPTSLEIDETTFKFISNESFFFEQELSTKFLRPCARGSGGNVGLRPFSSVVLNSTRLELLQRRRRRRHRHRLRS